MRCEGEDEERKWNSQLWTWKCSIDSIIQFLFPPEVFALCFLRSIFIGFGRMTRYLRFNAISGLIFEIGLWWSFWLFVYNLELFGADNRGWNWTISSKSRVEQLGSDWFFQFAWNFCRFFAVKRVCVIVPFWNLQQIKLEIILTKLVVVLIFYRFYAFESF